MILNLADAVTIVTSDHFDKWLRKLKDKQAKYRIHIVLRNIEVGELGEVKALKDGLYEKKLNIGPGYRLYLAQEGNNLVLLLIGGDKSTQQADIEKARRIRKEYYDQN